MLHNVQSEFSASIFDSENALAENHIVAGKLTTARRLAIYRHNVYVNLMGTLREIYPVTERIVGVAMFDQIAKAFVENSPSLSGDLNDFGGEFAQFLQQHLLTKELPYLPDVARLEWAWHRAFHSVDQQPFNFARLSAVSPDKLDTLIFILHPSVQLIQSAYPLLKIWQVNQPEFEGDMALDWEVSGDLLLLARRGFAVEIRPCAAAEFAFLQSLAEQKMLGDAVVAASSSDDAFDLQAVLANLIQTGVIIDFKEKQT